MLSSQGHRLNKAVTKRHAFLQKRTSPFSTRGCSMILQWKRDTNVGSRGETLGLLTRHTTLPSGRVARACFYRRARLEPQTQQKFLNEAATHSEHELRQPSAHGSMRSRQLQVRRSRRGLWAGARAQTQSARRGSWCRARTPTWLWAGCQPSLVMRAVLEASTPSQTRGKPAPKVMPTRGPRQAIKT